MHKASLLRMKWFRDNYLNVSIPNKTRILDVGSYDVNGNYKILFPDKKFDYTGLDMVKGPNVDIVLENPYDWSSIKNDSYDVLISGQTFEHTEFFWITLAEMIRVLKVDGILCIIAPNGVGEHRCPVDCYRFFSDGMVAFARYFDLEIIHVDTNCGPKPTYKHLRWYSHKKADSMLIAKKRYTGIARVIDLSKYRCVPINQNDFSSQMVPYRELSYLSKFIVKYYYFYDRLKILLYYLRVGFPHK